jgi:hypothetical protein
MMVAWYLKRHLRRIWKKDNIDCENAPKIIGNEWRTQRWYCVW